MNPGFGRQIRSLISTARRVKRIIDAQRPRSAKTHKPSTLARPTTSRKCAADEHLRYDYPGDFTGKAQLEYSPVPDDRPDPGEIVWTWVPYEEDHCRGKDRPVLLVGRYGKYLLAAMLTTKDRNNDHSQDPDYIDIGTGPWDVKRRPSEVKLDRILQINPDDVRRNGAVLSREKFEKVQAQLEKVQGWTR